MTNTNEYLLRILAAYAPCKAMLKDRGIHLVGVNFGENEIIYADLSEDGNYDYDAIPEFDNDIANCKPVLTPLIGITDEHAIEVAKIVTKGYCRHFQDAEITFRRVDESKRIGVFKKGHLDNIVHLQTDGIGYYQPEFCLGSKNGDLSVPRYTYFTPNVRAAYDLLRKLKYDVGFENISSLIEAGLAIGNQGDPKLFIEWNEATDSLKITAEKKDEKETNPERSVATDADKS